MSAVTLHPLTVASIVLQGADDRGYKCGCEAHGSRGDKWWPCDYHRGYDDATDSEAWRLLLDLLRDESYVRDCTGVSSDALDACLANPVLRAEVER